MHSHKRQLGRTKSVTPVLILVLMEDALAQEEKAEEPKK